MTRLRLISIARVAWALPWTLLGLAVGGLGLVTRGGVRRGPGILEFHGGAVTWLLERTPGEPFAMTLGHVVLGRTAAALDLSQAHELIHVRQYERWGPLFIPAYLTCMLLLWLTGKDGYRDNPFEREAYDRQR
jgi:hypothetical protein